MAGRRQHRIMLLNPKRCHFSTRCLPHGRHDVDGFGVGMLQRGQNDFVILVQQIQRRFHARFLAPSDRVSRHESFGNSPKDFLRGVNNTRLATTAIGDDGSGSETSLEFAHHRLHRPHRNAQEHDVCVAYGNIRLQFVGVDHAQFDSAFEMCFITAAANDLFAEICLLKGQGQRAAISPTPKIVSFLIIERL